MGKSLKELAAKERMLVIGLGGGASFDGADAALCELAGGGGKPLEAKLIAYHDEPYSADMRTRVLALAEGTPFKSDDLCRLNFRVGQAFARAARNLLEKAGKTPEELDLVGFHGQTLSHLPPRSEMGVDSTMMVRRGSTFQLGEPAMIAELLTTPVVANFRVRDVAAGGQGGPLGPYVDYLLFSHPERTRAAVNIGGISNVTYLPKGGRPEDTLAFDSGPGSMIVDGLVQLMTLGRERYDKGGALGRQGRVDGYVLTELLKHPYLQRSPPKSTGREEFGSAYARYLYEWGIKRGVRPTDVLCTATAFTAITLADAFKRFLLPKGPIEEIIVSGGGTLNSLLMARLHKEFDPNPIKVSDEFGVPSKGKEALVFAVLARETILGRSGNLPSATGAAGPRILGQITPA
jgi:anhydro-N-acetylmuramic acid kinase